MIRYTVYIAIIAFLISCGNNKIKKPNNLISQAKMVDVIVDLSLLNSASGIDKTILENQGIEPQNHVYKKHSIDSLQFATSNNYYAHNIDIYKDIYAKVKLKLNSKKEDYKKIEERELKEKKIKDSIKRAERKRDKPGIIITNETKKPTQLKPILKKGS